MQTNLNEIQKVLITHGYSINSIISDVMRTFKFRSLCHKVGFKKQEGYSVTDIITLLLVFPLMLLNSVNAFFKSDYQKVTEMKKDALYRLKNNERMPWRSLLLNVSKQFQRLVNPEQKVADKAAFILDDTVDSRVGRKMENITYIHDHVASRVKKTLGFKNLTLGFFDGKTMIPLDFSLHSEKKLKAKYRKEQFQKRCIPCSNGQKRRKECTVDKITNGIRMIKRAVKHGFKAKYVLVDSWFSSKGFIQSMIEIKSQALHIICAVRKDKRNYIYNGSKLNAKQLLSTLKKEGKEKRCRKRNTRYFEVIVDYEGVGEVKLYFCRFPFQKDWKLYLSTDPALSFLAMMEIYSVRWTIEIFFRETKQYLKLGKCQSRDFDAQIAHVTTTYILYVFLAYFRRVNDYETLGGLFEHVKDEMIEKSLAERLWDMFEELLQVVITAISESGSVDIKTFKNSPEYQELKELFEHSFLGNQLFRNEKAA
ncbi:IS4 family transposase [Rummeliibacillus suwonensis]|uniref:IS4 family transposase n=1 Tax=Rummeliibacillus suwonensis TaxID=1306154 RepID=UPI00289A1FB3|nr:transposase [Rummeliibacillus suwonensis]